MRTFILIIISFFAFSCSYSQQQLTTKYNDHWKKSYINKNGEEVYVGIDDSNYKNNKPKIRNYVVKNQSDLVLQKEFYESSKVKSIGYYRLIYDTNDENYRWVPDLLWTYYDENEKLIKQETFINGVLVKD